MIQRKLLNNIKVSLQNYPVVSIIGARQTGKTTIAKLLIKESYPDALYLDLELPSDFAKLNEAELYLKNYQNKLVVIDEAQRMPELFPLMRSLVDIYQRKACFLILGSSSPVLKRQASESLAGRIIYHELSPLSCDEIDSIDRLWLRGGFPLSYLAESEKLSYEWRQNLITTYLERDIPELGIRIPSIQLRRFWQMIAHSQGQAWNASKIASSLAVTAPTVKHYLDILSDTFIVRQLLPYFPNIKKRLIKSPKVYIRDSGILHALLGMDNMDILLGHPSAGASWEGFIIEQILGFAPDGYSIYFYRTSAGAELDLVIISAKAPIAIEIKRTLSPSISRGFRQASVDIQSDRGFIVYPGNEFYPLSEKVFALPINMLRKVFENF
jgi:uncharacterized protein